MMESFDQIESKLQSLIEGSVFLFIPIHRQQNTLAHELVELMKSHLVTEPDGRLIAPSLYLIHINPSQSFSWLIKPDLLEKLSKELEKVSQKVGFSFLEHPRIELMTDQDLPADNFWIEIPPKQFPITDTSAFSPSSNALSLPPTVGKSLTNSFIILDSNSIFHLGQTAINIGRRADNHLVINDPRVSRVHAQIRPIKGHYVIFDLNSKGGTFINNKRISQATLTRGDVISLAGVPLIFGQDAETVNSDTVSIEASPSDEPENLPEKSSHAKS